MTMHHDISLADIGYYRIGGKAKLVLEAKNVNDVIEALNYIQDNSLLNYIVLGFGANIVLPDHDTDAVLWIHNGEEQMKLLDSNKVWAFAGETLDSVIKFSFANMLTGLGWAGGLPSSVGGAVRGNAGCFGSEMRDVVFSVQVIDALDLELHVKEVQKYDCHFAYRESGFKYNPNFIIVGATVQLNAATSDELAKDEATYHKNIAYRQAQHPMDYPSCGSVFKNIVQKDEVQKITTVWPDMQELSQQKWHNKISMAYVIGRLGFAGHRVGDAQVSEKHNNYISNVGHAKAEDVKNIVAEISHKFEQTFGFAPEAEVQIIL